MANSGSIPQPALDHLPDFRNPGVIARILVIVHLGFFLFAAFTAGEASRYAQALTEGALIVEPGVAIALMLCYAANPLLARMRYGHALAVVTVSTAAATALVCALVPVDSTQSGSYAAVRDVFLTVLCVLLMAEYFRLRSRALSPALVEARLQSLQARIRPHFLFNSLNTVLSVIRSDPRCAEQLVEDLADLFRTLMADNTRLVPLSRELELVQGYLRIESLRLGDRLTVQYAVDAGADASLVPPLFLQPIVENAVYHGIEPRRAPGTVAISVRRDSGRVRVAVSNPVEAASPERRGNRMALSNIKERLALHFDAHATLSAGVVGDRYEVNVDLPFRAHERGYADHV
jgi:two-component system sensor histidine kinase AlgZ